MQFYLPPPGAVLQDGDLKANVAYPGLQIEYSLDQGQSWLSYPVEGVKVQAAGLSGGKVLLRTKGPAGNTSRVTHTE